MFDIPIGLSVTKRCTTGYYNSLHRDQCSYVIMLKSWLIVVYHSQGQSAHLLF